MFSLYILVVNLLVRLGTSEEIISHGAKFTVWSVRNVLWLRLLRWFLLFRQWRNKHLVNTWPSLHNLCLKRLLTEDEDLCFLFRFQQYNKRNYDCLIAYYSILSTLSLQVSYILQYCTMFKVELTSTWWFHNVDTLTGPNLVAYKTCYTIFNRCIKETIIQI